LAAFVKTATADKPVSDGHLLWLSPGATEAGEEEWGSALADLTVTSAVGIAAARTAIAEHKIDCALVTGSGGDADRIDLMDTLNTLDKNLPFVFWDR
jgi:hypothetical protein